MTAQKMATAMTLGSKAFTTDRTRVPGADAALMTMVTETPESGDALMRGWLKGWDLANLAAPL